MEINQNLPDFALKLVIFFLFLCTAQVLCQETNNTIPGADSSPPEVIHTNISYGSHPQQIMDIYLPAIRNVSVSKVLLLIHGGGWTNGSKEQWNILIYPFSKAFPQHVIVTMGYRLATPESPAYPKQIEDISSVISYLKSKANEYSFQPKFALMGMSAGAHLSMLYGYGFDKNKDVQVICNYVGPSSFLDPSYTKNQWFELAYSNVIGNNVSYPQNKTLFEEVSPVTHIKPSSPKTISFYGETDPLVPKTQGLVLDDALDSAGVISKIYWYPGGHGDNWTTEEYAHLLKKTAHFVHNNF